MDDLKGEMKSESYKRLLNNFKFKEAAPDAAKTKAGLIVVSAAQTNVRKTPRVSGSPTKDKLLIFGKSNIKITKYYFFSITCHIVSYKKKEITY